MSRFTSFVFFIICLSVIISITSGIVISPVCTAPGNQVQPEISGTRSSGPIIGILLPRDRISTGGTGERRANSLHCTRPPNATRNLRGYDRLDPLSDSATTGSDLWVGLGEREQPVCTAPGHQTQPEISGDTIVWTDYRNFATTGSDIYRWDPVNGEQPVCTAPRNQPEPEISEDMIIWRDNRNYGTTRFDIYLWDPVNGEQPVCTAPGGQWEIAISGTR